MSIAALCNATITLIKPKPVSNSSGKLFYGSGTVVNVRCFMEAPRRNQVVALAERKIVATAVAYIPKPSTISIAPGSLVTVVVDQSAEQEYEAVFWTDQQKAGGLSHFECFLKGV